MQGFGGKDRNVLGQTTRKLLKQEVYKFSPCFESTWGVALSAASVAAAQET